MKGYIYQGLGNSFAIIKCNTSFSYKELAIQLCNKYKLDGLITYDDNFKMTIYNKDGSKALMCGNGIRCLVQHLYKENKKDCYLINTDIGIKKVEVKSINPFISKVNLGNPRLIKELNEIKKITIDSHDYFFNSLFLDNYHVIIMVDNIDDEKVINDTEKIFHHPLFKTKCNITFCQIITHNLIKTRTYERGVGFTLSCGTGSTSAAYISYLLYNLSKTINVIQPLGTLKVEISSNQIFLEGESEFVKEIDIYD